MMLYYYKFLKIFECLLIFTCVDVTVVFNNDAWSSFPILIGRHVRYKKYTNTPIKKIINSGMIIIKVYTATCIPIASEPRSKNK